MIYWDPQEFHKQNPKVYPTNLEGFVCENSGPLAVFGKSNVSFIGFICFIFNPVNNRG